MVKEGVNLLPSLHCSSPDINESSDGQREAESASPDSGYDQQTTSPNSSKSPILIKDVLVKFVGNKIYKCRIAFSSSAK